MHGLDSLACTPARLLGMLEQQPNRGPWGMLPGKVRPMTKQLQPVSAASLVLLFCCHSSCCSALLSSRSKPAAAAAVAAVRAVLLPWLSGYPASRSWRAHCTWSFQQTVATFVGVEQEGGRACWARHSREDPAYGLGCRASKVQSSQDGNVFAGDAL
jgi:hypothetical protein